MLPNEATMLPNGSHFFYFFVITGFLVAMGFLSQPVYANFCAVNVTSLPPGAKVYINDEYVGDTPVFYTFGAPVLAEVVVKKEGYQEWRRLVEVPLDAIVDIEAELKPVKAQGEAKAKPEEEKGICGPTALLALAMLPLWLRLIRSKDIP